LVPAEFILAYILDLLLGDPPWLPHPVRFIGRFIHRGEAFFRRRAKSSRELKTSGILLALMVCGLTFLAADFLIYLAESMSPIAGALVSVFIAYTTLATKDLYVETRKVFAALQAGDLPLARQELSLIVGRDTGSLEKPEILRALLETIAENISDGVIAPLFYLGLGGPSVAMTYKAINTLDSMVGYKNEKYRDLGWASAKLDDLANFIPARLAGCLIVLAAFFLGKPWKDSLHILKRDHDKHESPNSAWPEAAMAGALGVQFGGLNFYFGRPSEKPRIGEKRKAMDLQDVQEAWKILFLSSLLMLLFTLLLVFIARDWLSLPLY
jgi:adenosylcobinamide-phosphate synthase